MTWVAAAAAFIATVLLRYLSLQGGYNDHFEHLAGAQQMLAGAIFPRAYACPKLLVTAVAPLVIWAWMRVLRLVPFFEYLDRCTTIRHRLLVADYAPEIYVYAARLFGGGHKGLSGRNAFLRRRAASDDERFTPHTDVEMSEDITARMLVNATVPPTGSDPVTPWPCYH